MRTEVLLIILIFLVAITGCYETGYFLLPQSQPVDEGDELDGNLVEKDKAEFPKLQSQLVDLIESPNPEEFANQSGIHYQDERVRVVIMLKDKNSKIAERFDIITEATAENMVQALVLLTQLGELSNEPYVNFIRLPYEPTLFK